MLLRTQIKPNPQSILNQFHSTWVDSEGVQGIYPRHNWLKFPKKYWYGPLPLEKQLNTWIPVPPILKISFYTCATHLRNLKALEYSPTSSQFQAILKPLQQRTASNNSFHALWNTNKTQPTIHTESISLRMGRFRGCTGDLPPITIG